MFETIKSADRWLNVLEAELGQTGFPPAWVRGLLAEFGIFFSAFCFVVRRRGEAE